MASKSEHQDDKKHPLVNDPVHMTPTQQIRTDEGKEPYKVTEVSISLSSSSVSAATSPQLQGYPAHARGYRAADLTENPDIQPARPVLTRHPVMVGVFGSALAVTAFVLGRGLLRK